MAKKKLRSSAVEGKAEAKAKARFDKAGKAKIPVTKKQYDEHTAAAKNLRAKKKRTAAAEKRDSKRRSTSKRYQNQK
jgi:hypothetical protein